MAKRLNDDLFEGTTMSFGQHLEELRVTLFKSMFGLLIGALIGMLVANWIVKIIQTPLAKGLRTFYVNKAIDEIQKKYPGEVPGEIIKMLETEHVTFEEFYFERNMLRRIDAAGKTRAGDEPPADLAESSLDAKPLSKSGSAADESPNEEKPDKTVDSRRKTATDSSKSSEPASEEPAAEALTLWEQVLKFVGYGPPPVETESETALSKVIKEPLPPPDREMVKIRVWRPLDIRITSLSAQEVFMIWMKASLIAGLVIASPYIFYQIWNFVAAGLYPHEKNYVYLYLPFSLGLFLAGAAMAFFFVFDPVLDFLFRFNKSMGIDPDPRINEWLSFVLYLPLGFGVSFQLPLVILFLNRIGLVSIETYLSKWRIAILTIFVISMVLTPAEPVSMLLMATPLTILYFLGIGLCKWMPRGRNPFDEGYEA